MSTSFKKLANKRIHNPLFWGAGFLAITGIILVILFFTLKKEKDDKSGELKRSSTAIALGIFGTILCIFSIIIMLIYFPPPKK